jgi:hypothetical protein
MIFESRPFSLGNFSGPDLNPRSVPPHLEEDEAAALKIFSLITWFAWKETLNGELSRLKRCLTRYSGRMPMDTVQKLLEITSRLEHLECSAEWITRETVQNDNGVAQTGTLIAVLADEIRERVCNLVRDLEKQVSLQELH